MKKFYFLLAFTITVFYTSAKDVAIPQCYPMHWWVGMKHNQLQLMIHGDNLAANTFTINYPGVKLVKTNKVENKNYVFLDLLIAPTAKPGKVNISGGKNLQIPFELKARPAGNGTSYAQGVTSADLVYLLMPDRFANGDASNDAFANMLDTAKSRSNMFNRHGGDLQGVIKNLDYMKDLGVTALWMTPVVENNMARTIEGGVSRSTYHGYAFTNQYQVDKRLGGNEVYKQLSGELHKRGMKLIQDAVYNHVGKDHFFIQDMPMKDWVNQWPEYTNTSYKDQPLVDPYASEIDRKTSVSGWFTPFLVDLNQRNPYVANFLIQYAIWATQEFSLDGWRVDTYFYSDPTFLNKVNKALLTEFPKLGIFGEAWVHSVINSAYFAENNLDIPFKHNIPGVTDFPLYFAMLDGLNQAFGWTDGVNKVYNTLAQDIAYKDPFRNSIFLDNHDLDRIYSVIGEDFDKYKMAMNWLLTQRGIPQLYYGTEILMKNFKNPSDAEVRRGFPGGWSDDPQNKFTKEGRTQKEQEAFEYISKLANFRKGASAITTGKLMQYVPEAGLYTYFRYSPAQTVMVISHTGTEEMNVKMARFAERTKGFTKLKNIQTAEVMPLQDFTMKPKQSFVFELLK